MVQKRQKGPKTQIKVVLPEVMILPHVFDFEKQ